jgi:hypothetical protein
MASSFIVTRETKSGARRFVVRYRRLTIWHQQGVPAREVAHLAGHSRTSESLDTYSHVMPPDELGG